MLGVNYFLKKHCNINIGDEKAFCTQMFVPIRLKIATPVYVLCSISIRKGTGVNYV